MARKCDYCGKGSDRGNKVSHAKNRTKTIRKPNLHSSRVIEGGSVVRRTLCTKCLRAAKRPERKPAEQKDSKKKKVVEKKEE